MAPRTFESSDTLERSGGPLERSEPQAAAVLPGWHTIPHAILRAGGEEGYVDLLALHPQKGVALLAFLEKDEVAEPEAARAACEEMLRELELARHFPGSLPIVAVAVSEPVRELEQRLAHAFASESAPTLEPGWIEWLTARLAPGETASNETAPRLAALRRDDDPSPPPVDTLLITPSRMHPSGDLGAGDVSDEERRWIGRRVPRAFALVARTAVALFSRASRLF